MSNKKKVLQMNLYETMPKDCKNVDVVAFLMLQFLPFYHHLRFLLSLYCIHFFCATCAITDLLSVRKEKKIRWKEI